MYFYELGSNTTFMQLDDFSCVTLKASSVSCRENLWVIIVSPVFGLVEMSFAATSKSFMPDVDPYIIEGKTLPSE